ncbi:hypothetical protein ABCY62_17535, partial [Acetivibrio clariflavus]
KLNANSHKITVKGDLIHSNENIYVGKGEILIKGNYNSTKNGIMYMENEEDYVCVEGDFYIATTSHKDNWIAGVLEVKGDFTQERNPSNGSTNNFVAKGSHKTILSGLKEQVVKFSSIYSCFNILEVKGTDNYVRFDSAISVNTFICERTINSNLELIRIVNPLESDIKINGDLIINYSGVKLNANGHKITVEGDLIHSNGNIYVGKGEILIKGNYNSTKNGIMYMVNEEDYVCVEGDFYIATTSHKDNWIAGVLEVKGDFTQERNPSNGSTNNFVAKGSHKTILSGLKEQVVKFSNTSSYFNILEVKGTDNYVRFDSVISVNTFICQRTINSNLKLKKIINPLEGSLIVNG